MPGENCFCYLHDLQRGRRMIHDVQGLRDVQSMLVHHQAQRRAPGPSEFSAFYSCDDELTHMSMRRAEQAPWIFPLPLSISEDRVVASANMVGSGRTLCDDELADYPSFFLRRILRIILHRRMGDEQLLEDGVSESGLDCVGCNA